MNAVQEKIIASVLEPGILENRILADQHIDVEDVQLVKKQNMSMMGVQNYVILVVSEAGSTISPEARKLTASVEFRLNTLAKAFLVDNLPHRIIGNFYLSFNKPAIPTRIFNNREKALEWLRMELKSGGQKEGKDRNALTILV